MSLTGRMIGKLPVWARTAPLDATFCVLGIPSSALTVLGFARSPTLIELLPDWGLLLWSVCLFVGCMAWLAGLTSIKENNGHMIVTRMPVMIFGLYLVSLAAVVFGLALVLIGGWNGVLAAWPVLVFAAGTYLRRVDLASRFRRDRKTGDQ